MRIKAKDDCLPNTGKIDFQKFLVCLYPNLRMIDMDRVNSWLKNQSSLNPTLS